MKGFLIFMVLVVGGSIYFFTHTADFGKQAIASLEAEEKPDAPAFQEGLYRDPVAFAANNQVFLEKRATIAKWLGILGEKGMMQDICKRSRDLYHDSNLSTDPAYGDMLWRSAADYDDQESMGPAQQSLELCRTYLALFPTGAHREEVSGIATRIQYKYNFK